MRCRNRSRFIVLFSCSTGSYLHKYVLMITALKGHSTEGGLLCWFVPRLQLGCIFGLPVCWERFPWTVQVKLTELLRELDRFSHNPLHFIIITHLRKEKKKITQQNRIHTPLKECLKLCNCSVPLNIYCYLNV